MNPLEIYRRLPRSNCGKCPPGTCMAFAVHLLRKMADLQDCLELTEEAGRDISGLLSGMADWKERRLEELLHDMASLDLAGVANRIGAELSGEDLIIPYMGRTVRVGKSGFADQVDILDKLLILMYINRGGGRPISGTWVAFRDLKDGLIRSEAFRDACEQLLARMFQTGGENFLQQLLAMSGREVSEYSADRTMSIHPLPMIPFLVLLWKGDEEFPADCKVLLDSTATDYLDIEALLYLGMALVRAVRPGQDKKTRDVSP